MQALRAGQAAQAVTPEQSAEMASQEVADIFEWELQHAAYEHSLRAAEESRTFAVLLGCAIDAGSRVTPLERALDLEPPRCSYCGTRQRTSWAKCPNCGAPS